MVRRKWRPFIDSVRARKVVKEIVGKRKRGNSIEEGPPNEWLRSFNSLMRATPPDFNKMLK